jgi:hypothetical protein
VKNLIDYIIREPEGDDHKKGHKYPFMASEILNCDVNKINDFFTATEAELLLKERKMSSMSNADSDMVLSSDDHLNAFSNEKKAVTQEESGEEPKEVNEFKELKEEHKSETKEQIEEVQGNSNEANLHNKSISELINVENLEESTQGQMEPARNRIELLDYLFSFLETDGDLNYVLVGYFAKFLNMLLNKFPHKIIGYIYNERPEILDRLLQHSDKKSIAEVVPKLLLVESYLSSDKDKASSLSIEKSNTSNAFANLSCPINLNLDSILAVRKTVLVNLFRKLSIIGSDPEKTSNIANICIEITENKNVLEILLAERGILEHLAETLALNLYEQVDDANFVLNYNYNEVLNVFVNIIRFTQIENLKTPTYKNEIEDIVNSDQKNQKEMLENTLLGECVLQHLEGILRNFLPFPDPDKIYSYQIEGTFGNYYKPLGSKRVKLVELVFYLLNYFKNVQSVLDKILVKSEFLNYLVFYFFQHEWNNLYQLNFENFMKAYLNNISNHPEMTRYLFEELKLLEVFIQKGTPSTEDCEAGFSFNSGRKINHGYFAILIELCHKLSMVEGNHPSFKAAYSTPEWEGFLKEKVHYWRKLFDRRLCVPEAPHSTHMDEFTTHHEHPKEDPKEETNETEEHRGDADNNPFQRDDYFFNMGGESDDWFNSKKNDDNFGASDMLEDINSFEFVDESRNFSKRKPSQEEILLKEKE